MMDVFHFEGMMAAVVDAGGFCKGFGVSRRFRTVLSTAPPGTGKELVARALHNFAKRRLWPIFPPRGGPVCNCAAVG